MKKFNEFITEEISPIRMDDDDRAEYERNRPPKYRIHTSQDGIIEFDDSMLEPYGKEEGKFFLDREWRSKFNTFINAMDVCFDKNKMFIFIEGSYSDMSEYKVFID